MVYRAWNRFDDGARLNVSGTDNEVLGAITWYIETKGARLVQTRIKSLVGDTRSNLIESNESGIPLDVIKNFLEGRN